MALWLELQNVKAMFTLPRLLEMKAFDLQKSTLTAEFLVGHPGLDDLSARVEAIAHCHEQLNASCRSQPASQYSETAVSRLP